MPIPEEVNPRKFNVQRILYNDNHFSIAWGIWENGEVHLGMRWNGDNQENMGYPKTFGRPVWFLIPQGLSLPFVKALLDRIEFTSREDLMATIEELIR